MRASSTESTCILGARRPSLAHAIHLDSGIPYTVTVHAVDLFRPRPSLEEVLCAAETVLAVADHHVRHLAVLGVESRRLRCGPDLARWRVRPLPGPELRALFVARNVPKKGLSGLLDVWSQLPNESRLEVISDHTGPVPPGVTVLGLQPPGHVRRRMAEANLLVQPSRVATDGDRDGVPVVLMEALASGRPVIAGDVGGVSELVDPSVGWLVPPDDPPALLQALVEALCACRTAGAWTFGAAASHAAWIYVGRSGSGVACRMAGGSHLRCWFLVRNWFLRDATCVWGDFGK